MTIYSSAPAVAAKIRTEVGKIEPAVVVFFGKKHLKNFTNADNGRVVVVPTRCDIAGPTRTGGNPKAFAAVRQWFDIHCYAAAPKQVDPSDQYAADYAQAEALRNLVLQMMHRYVEGAKEGGSGETTDAGANTYGVALVLTIAADLEAAAAKLDLAPVTFDTEGELITRQGSFEPA